MSTLTSSEGLRPVILSSQWIHAPNSLSATDYFKRKSKIGSYGVLELVFDDQNESQNIVVDENWKWLNKQLLNHFGTIPSELSLDQAQSFIETLQTKAFHPINTTTQKLFRWRKQHLRQKHKLYYLDDLVHDYTTRPIILALAAQMVLERFSRFDSRLAIVHLQTDRSCRKGLALLLKANHSSSIWLEDVTGQFRDLQGISVETLSQAVALPNGDDALLEIPHSQLYIHHPDARWNPKARVFSLFGSHGEELKFQVMGRSPAEKRFKREAATIAEAGKEELVPVEIGFHPYWRRLGHTSLRIGDAIYEMTSKGWKSHSSGANNARAFLFNNPFFKAQHRRYERAGMPPVSVATTVLVKKSLVTKLWVSLENRVAATGKQREKFSLLRYNCNHGIMRVLKEAGLPGFNDRGYEGFSSVLSFRKLLLNSQLPVQGHYVYPLPGSEVNEANLRRWVPNLVYRHNNVFLEMFRAYPSLLLDAGLWCLKPFRELMSRISNRFSGPAWEAYHLR